MLIDRLIWAKKHLDPVRTKYRVVYKDIHNLNNINILIPDPNWMAAAMFGNILIDKNGGLLPPLSEEEAIEQLIIKDVPSYVWNGIIKYNNPHLVITTVDKIPVARDFRNAWEMRYDH